MGRNNFEKFKSDYIKRAASSTLENKNVKETDELSERIGQFEYGREGSVAIENEKLSLNFDYSFAEYHDYVYGAAEEYGLLAEYDYSDGWRKLERCIMRDKRTGTEMNMMSELPEGYEVLFHVVSREHNGGANVYHKGCFVLDDPASLQGLLILLHEIGHCVDYEKSTDKDEWKRNDLKSAVSEKDIEGCLRKERNASAYMLNKLRPFIGSGAISKDVVIHDIYKSILLRNAELGKKVNEMRWNRFKDFIGRLLQ